MRRPAIVLFLFLACCTAACSLRRQVTLPSPYCRRGNPLAGVYHPQRLNVKSGCRVAVGIVDKVKFEAFDGDVHVDLRPDPPYEHLLAHAGQSLVVEIIPQDRSRVAVPAEGARIEVAGPWVEDSKHGWNEITRPGGSAPARSSPRAPRSSAASSSCSKASKGRPKKTTAEP
ncbi:MAG TPA: hypothetical protein VEG40_06165 [Gaiellaceae bacterium]|nr:hypothetical protein [Gaiellaceae bacterium]